MIAPAALADGARVGAYSVGAVIRRSRDGVLYRAAAPDGSAVMLREFLPRDVAVRRNRGRGAQAMPGAEKRFAAEYARFAALAMRLKQIGGGPFAPIDVFEDDGALYAVETPSGLRLDRALADGVRRDLGPILAGCGRALAAIHAAGVLHLDVKPGNVALSLDGGASLVDAYAGRPLGDGPWAAAPLRATRGYAAPEIIADGRASPAADVYSLCALAHALLMGEPPHRLPPPCPPPGVAPPLWAAVRSGLAPAPDDRPSLDRLIAAFADAQTAAAQAVDPDAPTECVAPPLTPATPAEVAAAASMRPRTPRPPLKQTRRRRPWIVTAAAVLMLFAGWRVYDVYAWWTKTDWIVDPSGAGDATTIAEAVRRARAGSFIYVLPGDYPERLTLEKPIQISGATGAAADVRIAPPVGVCLWASAETAALQNATLVGAADAAVADGAGAPCVVVAGGVLTLENVRISDGDGPALRAIAAARVTMRASGVDGAAGHGVLFEDASGGLLTEVRIANVGWAGVVARTGAAPVLRAVRIARTGAAGLLVASGGLAEVEDLGVDRAGASALEVRTGGRLRAVGVRAAAPAGAGLFVHDKGDALVENLMVARSGLSGVVVGDAGVLEVAGARVIEPAEHGVVLLAGSGGALRGVRVEDPAGYALIRDPLAGAAVTRIRASGGLTPPVREGPIGLPPGSGR